MFPPTFVWPLTVSCPKVTEAEVPIACPMATVGVAPSPELLERVTPVPATRL